MMSRSTITTSLLAGGTAFAAAAAFAPYANAQTAPQPGGKVCYIEQTVVVKKVVPCDAGEIAKGRMKQADVVSVEVQQPRQQQLSTLEILRAEQTTYSAATPYPGTTAVVVTTVGQFIYYSGVGLGTGVEGALVGQAAGQIAKAAKTAANAKQTEATAIANGKTATQITVNKESACAVVSDSSCSFTSQPNQTVTSISAGGGAIYNATGTTISAPQSANHDLAGASTGLISNSTVTPTSVGGGEYAPDGTITGTNTGVQIHGFNILPTFGSVNKFALNDSKASTEQLAMIGTLNGNIIRAQADGRLTLRGAGRVSTLEAVG